MAATPGASQRARRRARSLPGLAWHAGTFLIINGFFWILDLVVGQTSLQWAYWISLFWGVDHHGDDPDPSIPDVR